MGRAAGAEGRAPARWWLRAPGGPLLAIVGAKVGLTLATDGRYGYHRDELYYLVSGHHLALGYVDFPPLTPAVARLSEALFGRSLVGLRVPALVAGVGVILLTAAMARHLGGSPRAQWLAGLIVATAGFFLGANGLFQTVSFDQLAWALALYVVVRLVVSGDPRWWVALGAAVGVGTMTKFTMPALVAGAAVATVSTPLRRDLRSPWPWLGALVAVAIAAPNLVWQVAHGWPSVDFLRGQNARIRSQNPTPKYVSDQLLLLGPFVLAVCGAGAVRLWRDVRLRALVLLAVTVEAAYLVSRGKGYYPLDVFPVLIAAGAAAVAGWARFRVVVTGLIVWALVGLPLALPVLPRATMLSLKLQDARDDYSAELGWDHVVATIASVYRGLPDRDRARVLTHSYSEAAAVDLFGSKLGLPHALSGHNAYWLWLPKRTSIDVVVAVGFPVADLQRWFDDVRPVVSLGQGAVVDKEAANQLVAVCRRPRVGAPELWSRIRLFS